MCSSRWGRVDTAFVVAALIIGALGWRHSAQAQQQPERPAVTLQLNQVGADGLERMLDMARRCAPTMNDADMAVSLYHALAKAREADAASAAQQAQKQFDDRQAEHDAKDAATKSDAAIKAKQTEIDKLKAEIEKLKAAPAPSGDQK